MKGSASELGTEKIGKLLLQYSVPAIIAMTASSLYNMVDSIFIGQGVGPLAISGLAITFPLMNLSAAFGSMVGVGASTLISVKLGQHDFNTAQKILGNVVSLNLILGFIFGLLALLFLEPILYFFGASEATLPYARDYMTYILLGNIITHLYFGLNAVLRALGHPQKSMTATILTVIVNTALDPLFIYGFGMGIKGAAIATILSQLFSLTWQLQLLSKKDELIHFQSGIFKPQRKIVKDTIAIGMSPFLMNCCACFVVVLINQGLAEYGGDLAIGAYGIVNRVLFVIVMIVMGLNQGMQPIAGYNYGAQAFGRMLQVLRYTIFGATAVTTIGFLIAELIPGICVRAFTTDAQLTAIAVRGMRTVAVFFPVIGFQMVTTNFFQSIGHAGKSIFLSLSRQLLILVPLLLILPKIWGLDGVWYAMPVSDFLASLIAGAMLYSQYKKFQ